MRLKISALGFQLCIIIWRNCFPLFRTVGSEQDSDEGEEAISPVLGTCCDAGQALIPGLVPLTDAPVTLILSHM
jgi:hypothetical protein